MVKEGEYLLCERRCVAGVTRFRNKTPFFYRMPTLDHQEWTSGCWPKEMMERSLREDRKASRNPSKSRLLDSGDPTERKRVCKYFHKVFQDRVELIRFPI